MQAHQEDDTFVNKLVEAWDKIKTFQKKTILIQKVNAKINNKNIILVNSELE